MSIVYMPSKNCPKCPFNTLCKEEETCPIGRNSPVNPHDVREELKQLSKVKLIRTTEILLSNEKK